MSISNFSNDQDELLPPVRSTFLTVLCVLTFLGSAYGIFSGLSTILTADKIVAMTQENASKAEQEKTKKELAGKKDPGSKFALRMMDSVKNMNAKSIKLGGVGGAIANVLTLLGAILMWRLNRKGFYLYVAGIIASVAVPYIVFGSDNLFATLGAIIPAFFGLIFIVMYAFNLKDMK